MSSSATNQTEQSTEKVRAWVAPAVEGPIAGKHDLSGSPPTAKQMLNMQKEAYEESFKQGKEDGHKQGFEEGKAEAISKFKAQSAILQNLLSQLATPLENLDDDIEGNIVELSLSIARNLVRREMKSEPGEIVAVVRESLGALPVSAPQPRIYLHPEDAEVVRNALSISDDENSWRIMEDLAMTRGDCRVETDSSLIDASVDARLSAISAKILGGERDSDSDAGS